MKRAVITLRETPHYRRDAFEKGVQSLGYKIVQHIPQSEITPEDLLVAWNRYGGSRTVADQFERGGGQILIAENGYLGNDWLSDRWYAISRDHHNGGGSWYQDNGERWASFGVDLVPYRCVGEEIITLPQRGIGSPQVAMPRTWPRGYEKWFPKKYRARRHPGKASVDTLAKDLKDCRGVITWGSGGAIKALLWGIPVVHCFPDWIGAKASTYIKDVNDWDRIPRPDRLPMFESLAGAMWRVSEIESGEAIWKLLDI